MNRMTRRKFLHSMGLSASAMVVLGPFRTWASTNEAQTDQWILCCEGQAYSPEFRTKPGAPMRPGWVVAHSLRTNESRRIDLPFFAHRPEANPIHPEISFVSMKWGTAAAVVNFRGKSVTTTFEAPNGMRYFGHALWSMDGERIYASAHDDISKKGVILVHKMNSTQPPEIWPSGGLFPHEIFWSSADEIAVINTGAPGNDNSRVTLIDSRSGKLKSTCTFEKPGLAHGSLHQRRLWAGGVDGKDSFFACVDLGLAQMKSEILSAKELSGGEIVSLDTSALETDWLALADPTSNHFGIFDMQRRKFLVVDKSLPSPSGIQFSKFDRRELFVGDYAGKVTRYKIIDRETSGLTLERIQSWPLGHSVHIALANW